MKKNHWLFVAFVGAVAPVVAFFSLLAPTRWLSAAAKIPQLSPESYAMAFAIFLQIYITFVVLLRAAWEHPNISSRQCWMLFVLGLAFSPACALPLYFYFITPQE